VAQLLTEMICLNKSPVFVSRLLDYDFLKDICQILNNEGNSMGMSLCTNYLYLLGNIAGDNIKVRNATIRAGTVPIIRQLLDQVN